jgi:ribosomal protein S6--L-glutamate ligase
MLPGTCVIHRRADLMEAVNRCFTNGGGPVVTKQDRTHCGHGIRRWESVETLYNVVSLIPSAYPFVLQPLLERFTDVRALFVGDYVEAYARANPSNFRQNVASGGTCRPFSLSKKTEAFCRAVMARGRFPFAHIDLQVVDETTVYLSEIALNGGITGAAIDRKTLDQKKQALMEDSARVSSGCHGQERIECNGR